jgi:hypothetical protein
MLAIPRRYVTRRGFNAMVTAATGQSHWQSWLEVGTDTLLALATSMILQVLWYGPAVTWARAGGLTVGIYILTLGRRYVLRRLFEWITRRQIRNVRAEGIDEADEERYNQEIDGYKHQRKF